MAWQPAERLPLVLTYPCPIEIPFRPYPFSEACDNPEKMLHNKLVHAFDSSIASRNLLDDDLPCTIRANFGTVVIASIFGAEIEQIENSPPWVRLGFADAFERILDCALVHRAESLAEARHIMESYRKTPENNEAAYE